MTLQVETYEAETFVSGSEIEALANEGETQLLIESLGLNGQRKLFSKEDGEAQPHPYRAMTKEEHFVFSTLFPKTTSIEEYSDGPIPLRVLQIAAHVKELNLPDMAYIGVMHPEKFVDDPILFAQTTYYSGTRYILARWGACLLPFEELREKAITKKAEAAKLALLKIVRDAQGLLENVEDYVRGDMAKGGDGMPAFYE